MSLTYSPDVAPDLEPGVVHWQPRHKTPAERESELRIVVSAGAVAALALALGLAALAALALGRIELAGRRRAAVLRGVDRRVGRLRRAF